MAIKSKSPLEKYRAQRPTDAATIRPPEPKKPEPPQESYRDFMMRNGNYTPTFPGDIVEGTCPYHAKVRKIYNANLLAICLQCYPELEPTNTERTDDENSLLDH